MTVLAAGSGLAALLGPWAILPFVGMLVSVAVLPLWATHHWHGARAQLRVVALWSAPVLLGLLAVVVGDLGGASEAALTALSHTASEYIAFIVLIGVLYTLAGGVLVTGDLAATPLTNTSLLAVGAVLANLVGTTGASMLLIRVLMRTNSERQHKAHIPVFFLFIVSNVGGALTPIGDPPLFIGYLRGVPFTWSITHLGFPWMLAVGLLLLVFFIADSIAYGRETALAIRHDQGGVVPIRIAGTANLGLLAAAIAIVALVVAEPGSAAATWHVREWLLVGLGALSLQLTPADLRRANQFSWEPVQEVAIMFIGIFVTMIPATALLASHGSSLGLTQPAHFFWATGFLSAVLDNAPTYAAFATVACAQVPACVSPEALGTLITDPHGARLLEAVSLGAVFCGAGTYIGNGPNFMVKAIVEHSGQPMPSFGAYAAFAAVVLIPVFTIVTLATW